MKKTFLTLLKIIGTLLLIAAFIYGTACWVHFAATSEKLDWLKDHNEIGDAIGGLTAPFIGITGAILVYVSFQAQLKANKMQFDALQDERIRYLEDRQKYENDRKLQLFQSRMDEVKSSVKDLELIVESRDKEIAIEVYRGINAFVQTINRLENFLIVPVNYKKQHFDDTGIYYSIKFILSNIEDLIFRAETLRDDDKEYILGSIKTFYSSMFATLISRYIKVLKGDRQNRIESLHISIMRIFPFG